MFWRVGVGVLSGLAMLAAAVAVVAQSGTPGPEVAQSGTPVALAAQIGSPVSVSPAPCAPASMVPEPEFPTLAEATPTGISTGTPVATPEPGPVFIVDVEVAAQIDQVARALAACLTAGDFEGVAELTTADFRGDAYGGGERLSRSDYLALARGAPVVPVKIVAVSHPVFSGMRTVDADVEFVAGHQLRLERWTFVFRATDLPESSPSPVPTAVTGMGRWLAHRIDRLEPPTPEGAATIQATLREYSISLSSRTVHNGQVVITGRNAGREAHEMLVLRLLDGSTTSALLRPVESGFPSSIEVAAQMSLLPGESSSLVLLDLEPGRYTIVCLFPDASGVPHLAFGQETTLTVL